MEREFNCLALYVVRCRMCNVFLLITVHTGTKKLGYATRGVPYVSCSRIFQSRIFRSRIFSVPLSTARLTLTTWKSTIVGMCELSRLLHVVSRESARVNGSVADQLCGDCGDCCRTLVRRHRGCSAAVTTRRGGRSARLYTARARPHR